MDFGIARAISDASSPMTQTAAVIGTAQYLSPEQARGEQVDARSDVYSLGCVLFEILTGEPPFKGDSPVAVAYQHVREDPQTPSVVNPDIPRELDSVILKAMSKNPANRYQTAADMRSDLVRVLGGQRPSAPMVMSDEDRTTILGAVDSGAGNYRRTPATSANAAAKTDGGEPDKKKNPMRLALMALGALIVVGIVGAFLWSVGPGSKADQVTMPDVTNQAADDAETTLQNLGFRVSRQQKPDAVVATGNVITTRPVGGVQVDEGSTITLEVSSGPEQVKVPRLAGLSQQEAQQELNAVGLRLDTAVARAPSDTSDVDKVIDQNPTSGASISLDSEVAITLGTGPEQIRIPDVTGQKVEVAQANIEGAGFKVQIQNIDSGAPKGQVVSTDPVGGSTAAKGDTIQIRVSNGNNIEMPDLTGKTVSQALAQLRSAGWSGSSASLNQTQTSTLDPEMVGKIISQEQPPGSEITKNGVVSVGVGALGIPR
jgi:serine/threonine-protein kinase